MRVSFLRGAAGSLANVHYKSQMAKTRAKTGEQAPFPATDEELMRLLATGDREALAELYRRHRGLVRHAVARVALHVGEEALVDLTQDVFVALGETARQFRPDLRFAPWLYGIAVNKARNLGRTSTLRRVLLRRHQGAAPGLAEPHRSSPERTALLRDEIEGLLRALSGEQREVLLMHAEGFSGEEIAAALRIPTNTVWTRLHRARRAALAARAEASLGEGDTP